MGSKPWRHTLSGFEPLTGRVPRLRLDSLGGDFFISAEVSKDAVSFRCDM